MSQLMVTNAEGDVVPIINPVSFIYIGDNGEPETFKVVDIVSKPKIVEAKNPVNIVVEGAKLIKGSVIQEDSNKTTEAELITLDDLYQAIENSDEISRSASLVVKLRTILESVGAPFIKTVSDLEKYPLTVLYEKKVMGMDAIFRLFEFLKNRNFNVTFAPYIGSGDEELGCPNPEYAWRHKDLSKVMRKIKGGDIYDLLSTQTMTAVKKLFINKGVLKLYDIMEKLEVGDYGVLKGHKSEFSFALRAYGMYI